jgi:hypothetical protein
VPLCYFPPLRIEESLDTHVKNSVEIGQLLGNGFSKHREKKEDPRLVIKNFEKTVELDIELYRHD